MSYPDSRVGDVLSYPLFRCGGGYSKICIISSRLKVRNLQVDEPCGAFYTLNKTPCYSQKARELKEEALGGRGRCFGGSGGPRSPVTLHGSSELGARACLALELPPGPAV